ncbi:3-keto-disaccharide hydrolase [Marinilabilia rubra]|uniref:DUF1080 domain-containing protein n=1 Tax=Marinilabilia rubra TaxID=2162893 RepID=A0A2U2BE34_9BACT|nr:DUF1080 domain-containing protein [Marinilabilia rubra]PWE01330.1 DUF1080 domain-containing protein [Marinilabilia rubra]
MKKKSFFRLTVIALAFWGLSSFQPESEWQPLLDQDLSQWDMYLSFKHTNDYNGEHPLDSTGNPVEPIGYSKNVNNVFSVSEENSEPILRISGEYYGCIFTKEDYRNYHLKLKVKWGNKKWEPRKDKLLDSGVLYHSRGECGVDYWRSWMLAQEFQIMEGHMGDYWAIANSAIDVRAFPQEGMMNSIAGHSQPFISLGGDSGRNAFCIRSADYESEKEEWTTLELICHEGQSLHIVNGHVVMVLKNSRFFTKEGSRALDSGRIQIQSEAAEVFFKDIRIRKIEKLPLNYAEYF